MAAQPSWASRRTECEERAASWRAKKARPRVLSTGALSACAHKSCTASSGRRSGSSEKEKHVFAQNISVLSCGFVLTELHNTIYSQIIHDEVRGIGRAQSWLRTRLLNLFALPEYKLHQIEVQPHLVLSSAPQKLTLDLLVPGQEAHHEECGLQLQLRVLLLRSTGCRTARKCASEHPACC